MLWDLALTYPLALDSGAPIYTLKEAADLFRARSETVRHLPPIGHAIDLLSRAAQTGAVDDIQAATEQVDRALQILRRLT
jgi:hypothetical protein